MSIKGTLQELYVGKKESNIISFVGNKKKIEYEGITRIDYMLATGLEAGYLDFKKHGNSSARFEFNKKANEKISKTIELISENNPELEICAHDPSEFKFYQHSLFGMIISFILGFPMGAIGLFILWHYKKGTVLWRTLVTVIAIMFWGSWIVIPYMEYKSSMNQIRTVMSEHHNSLDNIYSNFNTPVEVIQSNTEYQDAYKAATYKVGEDMPAGEYVLFAESSDVNYFQIADDSSGSIASISANGVFKTDTIVTVESGQYFNFIGCYAVPITEAAELDTSKEGMFKIGVHLEPGEYQLWATDGADVSYYAVMKDSTHKMESIKTNGVIESREYVTVEKGDYLELQGCYIIE